MNSLIGIRQLVRSSALESRSLRVFAVVSDVGAAFVAASMTLLLDAFARMASLVKRARLQKSHLSSNPLQKPHHCYHMCPICLSNYQIVLLNSATLHLFWQSYPFFSKCYILLLSYSLLLHRSSNLAFLTHIFSKL